MGRFANIKKVRRLIIPILEKNPEGVKLADLSRESGIAGNTIMYHINNLYEEYQDVQVTREKFETGRKPVHIVTLRLKK